MVETTGTVLTLIRDADMQDTVERVVAAAGLHAVSVVGVVTRRTWLAVVAVMLDEDAARRCARSLPRRGHVVLLTRGEPSPSSWSVAIDVGAQHVYRLPAEEADLVGTLSGLTEIMDESLPGRVIAVIGGRGGAGASVFSVALAAAAQEALLIDMDAWSGGLDLLLGKEGAVGLRWPDLVLQAGRLNWTAIRAALPRHRRASVLSGSRSCHEIDPGPAEAIITAGRRGGATVICDVPRRMSDAAICALDSADLVVMLATCDVRGIAATASIASVVREINPNIGLVVRGPAPGGLHAVDVAAAVDLPLVSAMRPESMLAERLERGGLKVSRRSALGKAAQQVLAVLDRQILERAA